MPASKGSDGKGPLACLAELAAYGVAPDLRIRGVRAMMRFSGVPFDRALAIDASLASAHPTAALYTLGCKRLMFNLASNQALHASPAEGLAFLSDGEMARGTVVERVQQQERARHQSHVDMLKERQHAVEQTQAESVLHCRRCASSNLNFVQLQLRSADEPMTCFLTCNACGHRWRMS